MSKRARREMQIQAAFHLRHYHTLSRRPQRGCLVYGRGLDKVSALVEEARRGFFVEDRGTYAVLR